MKRNMKEIEDQEATLKAQWEKMVAKREESKVKSASVKADIKKVRQKFDKSVKEFGSDQELDEGVSRIGFPAASQKEDASQPVEVKDEPRQDEDVQENHSQLENPLD